MKRTDKSRTPMADKIQTMIPRYGELNRIYRDYIGTVAKDEKLVIN